MNHCQLITSKDNPLLQRLRKLATDPAAYRKLGDVWVEGDHLCTASAERSLALGLALPLAVIAQSAWTGPDGGATPADAMAVRLSALACRAQRVAVVPDALWRQFTSLESPARIGYVWPTPLQAAQIRPGVMSMVLDRLQDAGNVGAILRTASALGVRQVVALKGCAALWSPKVLRAGMGAHWALHLVEQACLDDLSALAVPMVATSSHADHDLPSAPLPNPCAWVMGHEGQGVSADLLAQCAMTVSIPQPGGEESLNVAVAAAICMYESMRRQQP